MKWIKRFMAFATKPSTTTGVEHLMSRDEIERRMSDQPIIRWYKECSETRVIYGQALRHILANASTLSPQEIANNCADALLVPRPVLGKQYESSAMELNRRIGSIIAGDLRSSATNTVESNPETG